MPIVQMPRGVSPVQVEFVFKGKDAAKEEASFERSVKGAIHFRPGCTKVITNDELAYIEKNKKKLAVKLHVVPGTKNVSVKKAEKKVEEKPEKEERETAL